MTDSFSLRALVEEIRDETQIADPGELAPLVLKRIPRVHYRAAMKQMIHDFVRRVVKGPSGPTTVRTDSIDASSVPGESWRRRAARILDRSECIDGAAWKRLGDCTADDLRAAAAYKRSKARLILAAADRVETAAKEMDRLGVTHVRDLPPETVLDLFGKKAAA